MRNFSAILYIFILTCINVYADQPRINYSFKSDNGLFELKPCDTIFSDNITYVDSMFNPLDSTYEKYEYILSDRYYWGLYDLRTNSKLYTIRNDSLFIEAKTAIISNDGKNIIIVDDYSGGFGIPNLDVLTFYHYDTLTTILSLNDLLDNICCVSYSVSHMTWCSRFKINDSGDFEILTYDFNKRIYSLRGELISKSIDSRMTDEMDVIVAEIKRLKRNYYSLIVKIDIRGQYEYQDKIELNVSDRTMKKIHGRFYGFLNNRRKIMEKEFTRTVVLDNNKLVLTDIRFRNYSQDYEFCNRFNEQIR